MYQETFVGINVTPKFEKPIKRAPTIKVQTIPENLLSDLGGFEKFAEWGLF